MGKIIRHEFLGSRFVLTLLCLTGIGIPVAIIYLIEATVTIEEDVDNPLSYIRTGKLGHATIFGTVHYPID